MYRNSEAGFWERISWYDKMEPAMQSLKDLTKKPKSSRIYAYTILPVTSFARCIQINEDKRDEFLKAAR